uniref:BTB domain-containing protein n=1 Tax=Calidris pygmaea TaxID=425635 RepID=A0A8C3K1D9_9CHAR
LISETSLRSLETHQKMSAMACGVFNELRLEGKLCDVTISVDGVEFNAHKNILCSCSHYFRALFASNWSNVERRVYKIEGTSPEMMRLIIEYAYIRTVPITVDNVQSLLVAADQFNVMGIVRLCCEFLKSQMCPENCIGIYRLADYCYCPDLREAALVFLLYHFEDVTRLSTEFLDLSVDEFRHILEKDELNVKQEQAAFEAILKWIDHSPWDRRRHIGVLLGKVRLALMHVEYFMKNVKMHDYVRDNEDCKGLIRNALTEMYNLDMHSPSSSELTRPRLPCTILFAIGGWSGGSPTNAIETYDSRADQWVNVTCEQERPLAYHGTAYFKGFIYVVGGFDSSDYFSSVKRFDPLKKTWQQVAPMHSRRCYVSVAVLNNFLYAMGGFDGHTRLNTAERYQPETNQWTLIAPMHEQRSDASATTLHGKVNGRLRKAWVNVTCEQEGPLAYHGTAYFKGFIYVVGGFDSSDYFSSVKRFDPVAVLNNFLYAMGGFDGHTRLNTAERYQPETNQWTLIAPMHEQRSDASATTLHGKVNGRLRKAVEAGVWGAGQGTKHTPVCSVTQRASARPVPWHGH